MDGFKNSTKTKYGAHGSACYAKGGVVKKAAAKPPMFKKSPGATRGGLSFNSKPLIGK